MAYNHWVFCNVFYIQLVPMRISSTSKLLLVVVLLAIMLMIIQAAKS